MTKPTREEEELKCELNHQVKLGHENKRQLHIVED